MSWGLICTVLALGAMAAILIFAKRGAGVVLFLLYFTYLSPMMTALAVAFVIIGYWPIAIATAIASCLSFAGLVGVQFKLSEQHIAEVAAERVVLHGSQLFLMKPSAFESPKTLTPPGRLIVIILEFTLVMVVVFFGPLLLPLSVTYIPVNNGMVAPVIWFLSVALFLGARRPMGDQIVLARAMAYRANAEC